MAKDNVFNTVLKKKQKRSTFDLSHDTKMSLDMGRLVPSYIQECIPGDSINIQSHSMLRFAPLISPVMHRIQVKMEYFFVPNRIIWNDWETFITGSRNGKQLPVEEIPVFPSFNPYGGPDSQFISNGSLFDYLGLPTIESVPGGSGFPTNLKISLLPFAAYQRIFDEYYRDENLTDSMYDLNPALFESYNSLISKEYDLTAVSDAFPLLDMRNRAWEHDYFTSALPFAQKGEAVDIPLSTDELRITGNLGFDNSIGSAATSVNDLNPLDGQVNTNPISAGQVGSVQDGTGEEIALDVSQNLSLDSLRIDNVDGTSSFATTINDLRTAMRLQEWLETNARGGTRYIESIYAHFGVKSSDKRLQRPEFIGSSRSNVIVSEVMQTSSPQAAPDTPQGNMSGTAYNVTSSRNFNYYCEEHGYIIGLLTVIPDTAYFQGIPKHFLKTNDRLEYYFPEFAHLGEQEIKNVELFVANGQWNDTFGYIPRYSEYRFINNRVSGDFRDTLKYWHMARDFAIAPNLNSAFISSNPSKRIFAVQSLPDDGDGSGGEPIRDFHSLYAHVFHKVTASRLMPKYGTPML